MWPSHIFVDAYEPIHWYTKAIFVLGIIVVLVIAYDSLRKKK